MPANFPSWKEMIRLLLEASRSNGADTRMPNEFQMAIDYLNNGEYAMAADILVSKRLLDPDDMSHILEDLFTSRKPLDPRMSERLQNLLHGTWSGILTTNYDKLIDEAVGRGSGFRKCDDASKSLGTLLSDPCRFYAKLHGESWRKSGVLTVEDYNRTYIREPYLEKFMESVMLSRHLVFVGCSLEADLLQMRSRLFNVFAPSLPKAYALLPDTPANQRRYNYLKDHVGIECWLYDPHDPAYRSEHGAVDDFLLRCAECRDLGEGSIPLISSTQNALLKSMGRANRMLLRAVLDCTNQQVLRADFADSNALQRTQKTLAYLRPYYSHYTSSELLALARRFIDCNLLVQKTIGLEDYLEAHPNLAASLAAFDQ